MDRAEISERFMKVAAEKFEISLDEIKGSASLLSLSGDSLNLVELVMGLEEEFDIQIPDEDAEKLDTVGKTIDYILKKAK